MRLRDLKRFVSRLVPGVYITSSRTMPAAAMGLAWMHDGTPMIAYDARLPTRERDLTILHECAHHVYGDTKLRIVLASSSDIASLSDDEAREALHRWYREQWREDRADRWAEQTLELLEVRP
jgi:Zn-dependent peptidase ImmA (M78 family)